jgi:hypothetical protein
VMQSIRRVGLVLLTASVLIAGSAVAVSASGGEFVSSTTGKTKSKQSDAQVFKTGAGTIECSKVTGTGEVKEGKTTTHKEVLTYSGCEGFGTVLSVSAADFEYNANGSAKLENTVTVSSESLGCNVQIEPQTLESIGYSSSSGKVTAEANVSKIHSKGSGGECGGNNTEGSYTGNIKAEIEGGTLEWK